MTPTLTEHPRYNEIIEYIRKNVNVLTYQELITMIYVKFKYKINCQETMFYHMKKYNIEKEKQGRFKLKHIVGLRYIFEKNQFKMNGVD